MHNKGIKSFRPNKKARTRQGYIDPKSCTKLYESQQNKPIIYRSSWEKQFVQWLEKSPHVLRWGSECICIPYTFDGESHHYYPDFIFETDKHTKVLVEIKPYSQTQQPDPIYPADSWPMKTYRKNLAKWNAALEFCNRHGLEFKIITERTIQKL